MTYATQTNLEDACGGAERLVQLSDWNRDKVADTDRITAALVAADGVINSYLVKVRTVPLVEPTAAIVDCAARIARYHLARARGMVTEQFRTDYEDDLKWLKAIADGEVALDVDPQPTASTMRIDKVTTRPTSLNVSRKKLQGFS